MLQRDRDERRGGRKRGEGAMVMMCLRMICQIDIANHPVPVVTPLGHTLAHTLANTCYTFRQCYQPYKYFSFTFFSKTYAYLKGCSVCMIMCVVHLIRCMCVFTRCVSTYKRISAPQTWFSCAWAFVQQVVCTQVWVCEAAGSPLICA